MAEIIKYATAILIIFLWLYVFVYCGLYVVSHVLSRIAELLFTIIESVRDFIRWHK